MEKKNKHEWIRQILSFGIIGVINTAMGLVIVELLYNVAHWGYWQASGTSYVLGGIYSYFANKRITFQVKGNSKKLVLRFACNIAVCYLIAYGVAKPMVGVVLKGYSQKLIENVAILCATGLFTVMNFMGQKFFVFANKEN